MGINQTPNSNRYTIGIFGKRNAGKSSLINALTGQSVALTSDVAGTTTDPVSKAMEFLPIGPVLIIDTAGLDDEGELGAKRIGKSLEALRKCDLVILVCNASNGSAAFDDFERDFLSKLQARGIKCVIALNQCGASEEDIRQDIAKETGISVICTDALSGFGIDQLKSAIITAAADESKEIGLTEGIVKAGDLVVLVTPIDSAAPRGRLILPQQQVLRDILDKGAMAIVVKESELSSALDALSSPPMIVITDSQAFKVVSASVAPSIPLTSFSILFARQKGDLDLQLSGIRALSSLQTGDKVLISEGCTHHRQCGDIGTVKIPAMLGKICPALDLSWTSGGEFPEDLSEYKLIIHCGGCMLNRNEMQYRLGHADESNAPITNYGMFIAYSTGILDRAIKPFGLNI